jgi:hypothetical protein
VAVDEHAALAGRFAMRQINELPAAFGRLREVGSVVEFGVFEDVESAQDGVGCAIRATLPPISSFNSAKLEEISGRPIQKSEFFGDWLDAATGELIKIGKWQTADGLELADPTILSLEGARLIGGAFTLPEPGAGGQFAFAVTHPPYPLQASRSEVQNLFEEVCAFLFPTGQRAEISDWSSPKLPELSDYFSDGMEWWGAFLFTIYLPDLKRLSVIAASATD